MHSRVINSCISTVDREIFIYRKFSLVALVGKIKLVEIFYGEQLVYTSV